MAAVVLTPAERAFLATLDELGVKYMIVGLSAAVLQGADTVTADIDLWLEDRSDPRIHEAAEKAGDVRIPGHVVTHLDGLETFASEYASAVIIEVDGLRVPVLPLRRVAASERAAADDAHH